MPDPVLQDLDFETKLRLAPDEPAWRAARCSTSSSMGQERDRDPARRQPSTATSPSIPTATDRRATSTAGSAIASRRSACPSIRSRPGQRDGRHDGRHHAGVQGSRTSFRSCATSTSSGTCGTSCGTPGRATTLTRIGQRERPHRRGPRRVPDADDRQPRRAGGGPGLPERASSRGCSGRPTNRRFRQDRRERGRPRLSRQRDHGDRARDRAGARRRVRLPPDRDPGQDRRRGPVLRLRLHPVCTSPRRP